MVFDGALEAVNAAVDVQRALAAEPWAPGVDVQVRMGLHAGEASTSAAGLVGIDVNRAARIAAAAHGGQVVVSDAVRSLVVADLDAGVSLRGLGNHRLKDLREPQPRMPGRRRRPAAGVPAAPVAGRSPQQPPDPAHLLRRAGAGARRGRRAARAEPPGHAHRPGRLGKTRLSLQVAANAAERYPDGVFFIALETVREPALVESRIASAIGLAESANRTADAVLREWLAGKQVLVVLDNFEQVVAAGPVVADLLRDAPGLSVLITSRPALRVSG